MTTRIGKLSLVPWRMSMVVSALFFGSSTGSPASITLSVDKYDASDGIMLPPDNIVVVDVFIDVSSEEAWALSAIYGSVQFGSSGSSLVIADYEPNGPAPWTAPGLANRFVTFVSLPRARDSDERFTSDGAALVFNNTQVVPVLTNQTIDLRWLRHVPVPPSQTGLDGYVARIALDLTNVTDPAFQVDSENIIVSTSAPPGAIVLFESRGPAFGGTSAFSDSQPPAAAYLNWGIYGIPEPAAGLLLVLGGAFFLRRR